jgi:hypothetical protein
MASAMYYLDLGIFGITASQGKKGWNFDCFFWRAASQRLATNLSLYMR